MTNSFDISIVPNKPGLYLLEDFSGNISYVGISRALRGRLDQHFNRRDSSVTTGAAAASLNPDRIHCAKWWLDPRFEDLTWREAAELVAFERFEPTLRSLGGITEAARKMIESANFKDLVNEILNREPDGQYSPLNLPNLLSKLVELEQRIKELEHR
jgi:hypothetical protein